MVDPAPDRDAQGDEEISRIRASYHERDRKREHRGAFTRASLRLADERLERMGRMITSRFGGEAPHLLDVGCGGGRDLAHWLHAGWSSDRLAGIDVVADRVEQARSACPGADVRLGDAGPLPFGDASFDVVTASVVLSSILDAEVRRALCRDMLRVVRPGGLLLIYDFVLRNPRNPNVRALPLRDLVADVGRPPRGSIRLSPLVYAVALGEAIHPRVAALSMHLAPPTHRLTWWTQLRHPRHRI